jgi:ribosomal protein S18 acetylase RimI-like enzyme
MQKATITIRPLQQKDIASAVDIHKNTIQSPGSEIGSPYLTHLYQSVCDDPRLTRYRLVPGFAPLGFGMVAEKFEADVRRIVGVILVTYDVERFGNIWYMLSDPKIVWHVGLGIVIGRIHLWHLLMHWEFQRSVHDFYQIPYVSIQALCVEHHLQHRGLGKALIAALIRKAKEKNIPVIYVDTLETNNAARKFYSSVGFKELTRAGDSVLYHMEV